MAGSPLWLAFAAFAVREGHREGADSAIQPHYPHPHTGDSVINGALGASGHVPKDAFETLSVPNGPFGT